MPLTIPVFYRPEQSSGAAQSFSPSAGKPKLVVEDWLACAKTAPYIDIQSFVPADDGVLESAHDSGYVRSILTGRKVNGFGNRTGEIAESLRYTVGSMVAAARHVLAMPAASGFRVAVSPTSGFHHAGYDFGGGFCTFNGLMVAAIQVYPAGLARGILIVDMDEHYGNGTTSVIRTLGIRYVDQITAAQDFETTAEVLQCADLSGNEGIRNGTYDLVLYQAGADIHIDDPFGGLLTTEEMIRRDELVFSGCARYDVPVVWNLAGGYQRDAGGGISRVLGLHRNTMLQCIRQMQASEAARP